MILSRVVGDVVSTEMNERLRNNRLLLVEPVDLDGNSIGPEMIALDAVDAGPGDLVLMMREGGSARIVMNDDKVPLQCVVVAVVDRLEVEEWARAELGASGGDA